MSEYEWKVSHCSEEYLKFKKVPEATQLEEVFNNCDDFSDCKKESWVIGIEKLVPLIPKGLPHSESRESKYIFLTGNFFIAHQIFGNSNFSQHVLS